MRIAVIGGGAVGATAAYDLARRDASVTVYERADRIGVGGSTGRAAGVINSAYTDRTDAEIASRALERFREWSGEGDFELIETPNVQVVRDGDERRAGRLREQTARMRELGADVELVDAEEIADRYPSLRTDDVAVAAVASDAGYAEPGAFARAVGERARAAGAEIRTGVEARLRTTTDGIVVTDGARAASDDERRFDAVLVAAGPRTKQVLADAGIPVPLKPYRVQALTTATAPELPMVFDATGGFYLRPHDDGLLFGNGTEEREVDPSEYDRTADETFVTEARDRIRSRVVGVDPDVTDAWAGLCVATPDRNPLVGPVVENVFVAAGWQGHGFMRSPATGELAADAVLGGDPIETFDPRRFDGDEEFEVVEGMAV